MGLDRWRDAQWWVEIGRAGVVRDAKAATIREGFASSVVGSVSQALLPELFTGDCVRFVMRGRAYRAVVIVADRSGNAALCVVTEQVDRSFTTSIVVGVPYQGSAGLPYFWDAHDVRHIGCVEQVHDDD